MCICACLCVCVCVCVCVRVCECVCVFIGVGTFVTIGVSACVGCTPVLRLLHGEICREFCLPHRSNDIHGSSTNLVS